MTDFQFCSDTQCQMGEIDKDGIAAFDQETGSFLLALKEEAE